MERFHCQSKTWTSFYREWESVTGCQLGSALDYKEDFRESNLVTDAQIRRRSPVGRPGPHVDRRG